MLTTRRAVSLGLVCALLFLVVLTQIPARVIGTVLPEPLVLEGLSGTIWHGQAARARLHTGNKALMLGQLEWSLRPWSLLMLRPGVRVETRWGSQLLAADLSVGLDHRVQIDEAVVRMRVGFIRQLLPLFIDGNVELDLATLEFDGQIPTRGDGRAVWRDAVWTANDGNVALGSYALDLRTEGTRLIGRVVTLSGPLQVAGEVTLEGRSYNVALNLTGSAITNDGLRDALRLMATPRDDGFDMVLTGVL